MSYFSFNEKWLLFSLSNTLWKKISVSCSTSWTCGPQFEKSHYDTLYLFFLKGLLKYHWLSLWHLKLETSLDIIIGNSRNGNSESVLRLCLAEGNPRTQFFWVVTPGHWIIGFCDVRKEHSAFEVRGTSCSVMWHHIQEELSLALHCHENFKTHSWKSIGMSCLQDLLSSSGIRVEGLMGNHSIPGGFKGVDIAICTIEKANSLMNR